MEPHDYWVYYVNIDLRHQYGISVAELQTFLLAKRPQRRARRNGCFRRLETKIKSNRDLTSNIAIEGYDFVSKPALTNAGGVGFFIKWGIQFHIRDDLYGLRLIGPKLWNELDERFKCHTSNQFKNELTSHSISLY